MPGRVRVIHNVNPWTSTANRAGRGEAAVAAPDARRWPADAALPASGRPPRRWDVPRVVRLAAALLGIAAIAAYLVVALARLTYPFTLEVVESNSLIEVHRLLAGQPLYAAPTVDYVPDGYPPLYFATAAALASVSGLSYLPLRLVSLVSSLVCFTVLARLIQRETASAAAGIAAAGLLAATYFAAGTWFDVARVDSLFLALSVAALHAARWMRSTRGAIAAGLLLAAAFLTKQTGLAEGVAVLAALAAGPRRRLAVPAALAYCGVVGGSTLVLGLASRGWYVYYVFKQMGEHALNNAAFGQFWSEYLLPTLGIACCALLLAARRTPLVLLAGCAALTAEGYAALVHSGGNVNDLLPAYLVVALLAGLAMGNQPALLLGTRVDRLVGARIATWRPGQTGRWAAATASALVIAQLAVLAGGYHPSQAIPSSADRVTGLRLTAGLRALGGTVLIPSDPGLGLTAGLPEAEDQIAAADVIRASSAAAKSTYWSSIARAVAAQRFSAILIKFHDDLWGFPPDLRSYYHHCPQMLLPDAPRGPFRPVADSWVWPVSVWLPVGRGSCATAVRALDGAPTAQASAQPGLPSRSAGWFVPTGKRGAA
jgi:Dolichyl-phosphate-mannose-protein mannosyltransferase